MKVKAIKSVGKLRITTSAGGFTLVEVMASMAIIAIILVGMLLAYQRTVDGVAVQSLKERGYAVAQRHMEELLASIQEPNSINLPLRDDIDPVFSWQLDLRRTTLETAVPDSDLSNTVIQAKVTVKCEAAEITEMSPIELVRYFGTHGLKPMPGHAVAVPITPEYKEPEWYQELREKLGREPTMEETLKYLVEAGEVPPEVQEELDFLEQSEKEETEEEDIDPCSV